MKVQGAHCNMFARVFVCGFTFLRYKLNVFLPPLPEVGCPKSLDIWNPWGKVVGRTGLRCEHFLICSLLRYRLNIFLTPFYKVGCPNFLEIGNPWGKVMERNGLRCEHFVLKNGLKLQRKKSLIFNKFCLTSRIFWYCCYYPHRSRDALSPVWNIFLLFSFFMVKIPLMQDVSQNPYFQ